MRNHALGFANQWGRPDWVDEADIDCSAECEQLEVGDLDLTLDALDEGVDVPISADPLLILIAAEEADAA